VVSEVGALSTKIINMRNEEVTIPNAVLVGSPIKNYSRLAGARGTLVSTKVTIGYDTPWRQVHAMLIAAAEQTPGLRALPQALRLSARPRRLVRRIRTVRAHGQAARTGAGAVGAARQHPGSVQYLRRADHVAAFRHAAGNNVVVPPEHWHAAPAAPDGPTATP
jgi:hypothetical protein